MHRGQRLPHFDGDTHPSLNQTPKVSGGPGHCSSLLSIWATLEHQALAVPD